MCCRHPGRFSKRQVERHLAACLRGGQKDSRCNSFDGREPSACDRAWGQGGLVWLFLQHEPGWHALHHRTSASPGVLFTASALSIVTAQ